jgi:Uma2 family endonuclease
MSTVRRLHYSYSEYLRALEDSQIRLEYSDGEIYAMAGGTPEHAELAAAAIAILRTALRGCRVATSDLKVHIEALTKSTFPDVSVVCGERRTAAIDANALINPTLLVEVTSDSTEEYDRGAKLESYKLLPSLTAVLIVSHRRPQVTVVERIAGEWRERNVGTAELVELASPVLRFAVDELYSGITLG